MGDGRCKRRTQSVIAGAVGERLVLPLAPMSADEVTELVASLLPADGGSGAAAIARDSGGNPFLVEALTRHAALGAHSSPRTTISLSRPASWRTSAFETSLPLPAVVGRAMVGAGCSPTLSRPS